MTGAPHGGDPGTRGQDLPPARRLLLERLRREAGAGPRPRGPGPGGLVGPDGTDGRLGPVSSAQERWWFLEQLEPGNPAHHVAGCSALRGVLDPAALERAVTALAARHPALRTVFRAVDGRPRACVLPPGPVPLPRADLRALPGDLRERERQRHRDEIVLLPFDLARGPLLRQRLLLLEDGRSEHLWCLHHAVVDGTSMALLARELAVAYAAAREGRTAGPPELPLLPDPAEHAAAQRRWLGGPRCRELEEQWIGLLRDVPALDLPFDGAAPARGGRTALVLEPAEAARLLEAARAQQLTPFMFFLAGFAVLLHRLAGAERFAIGTPVAGREPRFAQAVGLFVNSLVLPVSVRGGATFAALAQELRARCLWAYDHQALPFERLVERLSPERDPHRHPLFQVLCNYVAFQPPATFADLAQEYEELPAGTLLDLTLWVRRNGDRLRLEFEFDARRFAAAAAARRLAALRCLLLAAAAAPQTPVAALPLIDGRGRVELAALGRGPELPPSPLQTLHGLLSDACARHPERTAVEACGRTLTYGGLAARAARYAAGLRALGTRPGDRIAVALPRDPDLVPALLGVLAAGAVFVPVDPAHPRARQERVLASARPAALLVAPGAAEGLAAPPVPADTRRLALDAVLAAGEGAAAPPEAGDPAAPAWLIHTSGSTGRPKGVLVPHGAAAAFLRAVQVVPGFCASDRLLAITTLGFDIAVLELFAPLLAGGTVQLAPAAAAGDPALLAELLADERITVLQATPTTWRLLERHGFAGRKTLRALAGGEPLPADLAAFLRARCGEAWNLYGPTETTVWSSAWRIGDGPVRIGRPLPGTCFRVLDQGAEPLPAGVAGELAIGGAGVASGYHGDPVRTAERFVADPLGEGRVYRTGDRVRCEEDGAFTHLGRLDDQLKVHGQRVEPGEIEAVLRGHAEVADVAVDLRGEGAGRRLCAWVVPRPPAAADGALEARGEREAHVARWTEVWTETYAAAAGDAERSGDPARLAFAGWRDSAAGAPLPAADLRAWYAATAQDLLRLRPSRVLEIGCGTGQLLRLLAPHCARYLALDPAANVLARLRAELDAAPVDLPPVELHCAPADRLDAVLAPDDRFDLVLLHSVVQYFPGLRHLLEVLDLAAARLVPGGHVFLGDVRLLPLQPALCASLALAAAAPDAPAAAVRQRAAQRARQDGELLLDPLLFDALAAQHPRFSAARVSLRGSETDDELTRFRADVLLSADAAGRPPARRVAVDPRAAQALELLRGEFARGLPFCAAGLADPRSAPWVHLAALLAEGSAGGEPSATAAALREEVARRRRELAAAPTPAQLAALAAAHGARCELRPGREPGTIDATFEAGDSAAGAHGGGNRPAPPARQGPWSAAAFAAAQAPHASRPLQRAAGQALVTGLRAHAMRELPGALVPQAFALLDALPRSPNGKLLRAALPDPEAPSGGAGRAPATDDERAVAAIFAEVLGVERVAADGDFFALGGHSLLATQVVARVRAGLGRALSLRALFAAPTVAGVCAALAAAEPAGAAVPPLPEGAPRPLLPAQERLWFLHRLEPASCAYHLAGLVEIAGEIAPPVLLAALRLVAGRHEQLCARIAGGPPAHLAPAAPELVLDPGPAEAFERAVAARAREPFDLGRQAPLRAWVHAGEGRTRVLLVVHHAAADGWSLAVLGRDLAAAAAAVAAGTALELPELPFAVSAWAAQQRARLAGEEGRQLLDWWRARLDGLPPALELPADLPRPPVQSHRGGRLDRALPEGSWAAAAALAQQCGATPFQVLAAAFAIWLARMSGRSDVAFGTVSAGRGHAGLLDQVGCFVDLLPLRVEVDGRETFAAMVARVREAAVAAMDHGAVPLLRLVEALAPPRDLSRPPLVQVTFELLEEPPWPAAVLGRPCTVAEVPTGTAKFDLTMRVVPARPGRGAFVQVEYCADLFEAATAESFWRSWQRLLEAALAAPGRAVASLLAVGEAEAAELLSLGDGGPAPPAEVPLHELVFARAARDGGNRAVAWDGGALSFAQLAAQSRSLARQLLARGVGPGAVVGIALPRGPELLPALLGTLAAGAAYLPLEPGDPPARRAALLAAAGARLVLGAAGDAGAAAAGLPVLELEPRRAGGRPAAAEPDDLPAVDPEAPAYVLFTSGSTGAPKGVVVPHRALVSYLHSAARAWCPPAEGGGSADEPGSLVHTALGFDLTVTALFAPLLAGRAVHLAPPGEGIEPLRAAPQGPFAFVKLTPSHLRALAAASAPLPAARTLVVGGEVLLGRDVAAALAAGVRVVNEYGPTETTVGCVAWTAAEPGHLPAGGGPLPIGRPLPGVRAYVLDGDLQLVPPGAVGELCIGGPGVALGYLEGASGADAARFCADPFAPGGRLYRTGDRARWRADGTLLFLGRADEQVKVLGVRIEPAEVAAALLALPGVRDAAVAAVPAPAGGWQLGAWVAAGADAEPRRLRALLAGRLPAAMLPRFVALVAAIPRNAHGKVDRSALPVPGEGPAPRSGPGGDAAVAGLCALFGGLLHADVGPEEDFFARGGDSILALQLVEQARRRGLLLQVADVFVHRTAAALAAVVRPAGAPAPAAAAGPAPLLPVQLDWLARELPEPGHDVQAVVCELAPDVDPRQVDFALAALCAAHPVLCARLESRPPRLEPGAGPVPRAQRVPADADLAAAFAAANRGHDPARGRMLAATLGSEGGRTLLHLSVHHLAVDAVSWRILLADLDRALASPGALPPAPQFAAFAQLVHARHAAGAFAAEAAHWRAQDARPVAQWPPAQQGVPAGEHAFGPRDGQGLPAAAAACRATVHELLLAAFAAALEEVAGGPVRIDVERHGRDAPGSGFEAGGVIGWCTAVHPFVPPALAGAAPGEVLRRTKAALRAVPGQGLGHGALRWLGDDGDARALAAAPPAPVLYDHLGDLELPAGGRLRVTERDPGPLRSAANPPSHPLAIDLWRRGGELRGRLRRGPGVAPAAADALLAAFAARLDALCAADPGGAVAPEDFPLARVDTGRLRGLCAAGVPEDLFPLSPTQQGMLVHALREPASAAYTEQLVHEVEGDLDAQALAAALGALMRRHALLRAAMVWRDLPEPHWLVQPACGLPFRRRDAAAGGHGPAAAAAFLRRFLAADRRAGFDLERAPLWRCTLVGLPAGRHAMVFTYHHALLDGWSMPLLLAELVELYAAARAGRAALLRPALPYRDFVAWLQRQDLAAARAFWRQRLRGCERPTPLGIDRPPPPGAPPLPHAEVERLLPAAAGERLLAFARELGTTGSTLVQAALALLLRRLGGSADVVFGLTVAGRPAELPGAGERIGLFINTVPVRIAVDERQDVRALAAQVEAANVAALPWHWTPLAVSQAQADAPAGRPLFGVLLVYENYPVGAARELAPPGLRTVATSGTERTGYPLTVVAVPGERWILRALFAPDRLAAPAVARLLEQLEHLLAAFAADPGRRLHAIDELPPAQRRALRARGTPAADAAAGAAPPGVPERIAARIAAAPQAPAIAAAEGPALTYGQLGGRARAIAAALRAGGVARGDVVALRAARGADLWAAVLGTWWAGAAVAPLDPSWPDDRTALLMAGSGARLLLTDDPGTAAAAVPVLALGEVPAGSAAPEERPPAGPAAPDDLALVLFTSGTTGRPKAVEILHGGLAHYAAAAGAFFGVGPADCVLQFASPTFDTAFEELLLALTGGARLAVRGDDVSPAAVLRDCERHGVTLLDLPTAWFHALVGHLQAGGAWPPCVRTVVIGGEAAFARACAAFCAAVPGVRLCNTYGPAEATIVAAWCELQASHLDGHSPVPIGAPVPGVEASVRGADGRLLAAGAVGELWLGGPGLARGYRGDPVATAEVFVEDPLQPGQRLYRTGDLVRWREDGLLEFCGRRDRQVKVRGQRVEPDGIEAALAAHPEVLEAAVVLAPAAGGGAPPRLVAFAVARPVAAPGPRALRAFLAGRLPAAAVPQRVEVLAALPRTAHGKVDRTALEARAAAAVPGAVPAGPGAADGAGTEGALAAVRAAFAAVLAVGVGPEDDFFALGGDSLAAIRLLDELRVRLGADLPLAALFAEPTPAAVAAALAPRGARAPAVPRQGAPVPPGTPGPDLEAELRAVEALAFPGRAPRHPPRRVLVTGGTGFLGSRVVRELLARTAAEIVVLARRPAPPADRAAASEPRVRHLRGALGPRPGLAEADFAALLSDLDAVYHVAANTHVRLPYAALRADNVAGTLDVLALCAASGAALHHVSTAGVFADPTLPADAVLDESFDVASLRAVAGGYAQSKWAAEQLVAAAARRGLCASVYRPGRLVAGADGVLPARDLGVGFFRLGLELGAAPDLETALDLTPVDWAAAALVHLSLQRAPRKGVPVVWHLLQDEPTRLAGLRALLDELGVPLRALPLERFLDLLRAHLQAAPSHPLGPLLDLLGDGRNAPAPGPRVRADRTHAALAGAVLPAPGPTPAGLEAALENVAAGMPAGW